LQLRELRNIHGTVTGLARRMLIVPQQRAMVRERQKRFGVHNLTDAIAKGPPYPVGS
jgi:hypothetical protein